MAVDAAAKEDVISTFRPENNVRISGARISFNQAIKLHLKLFDFHRIGPSISSRSYF
jgi:hypothetical protein